MEFRPERHRVLDLVLEVRDVIWPLAEKKRLDLSIDAPAEITAMIDGGRFKQVLYNYLSNAVKFTPEGGSVSVRLEADGAARFRLEVRDTGIGIAPEELPRLFQEFAQLPNVRKRIKAPASVSHSRAISWRRRAGRWEWKANAARGACSSRYCRWRRYRARQPLNFQEFHKSNVTIQ